MLKELRAASYLVASDLLYREPCRWDVIAILDSESELNPFVMENARRCLVLYFDDIERPMQGYQHVTSKHIDQAIVFAKDSERLLITCRAGQSRSVALAFVLAFQHFGLPAAIDMLNAKRHIPNQFLIREASLRTDCLEMVTAFQEWRADNASINFADYYDEMSDEVEALEASGVVNRISID